MKYLEHWNYITFLNAILCELFLLIFNIVLTPNNADIVPDKGLLTVLQPIYVLYINLIHLTPILQPCQLLPNTALNMAW